MRETATVLVFVEAALQRAAQNIALGPIRIEGSQASIVFTVRSLETLTDAGNVHQLSTQDEEILRLNARVLYEALRLRAPALRSLCA